MTTEFSEKALVSYLLRYPEKAGYVITRIPVRNIESLEVKFLYEIMVELFSNERHWSWEVICDIVKELKDGKPMGLEYPDSFISALMVDFRELNDIDLYINNITEKTTRVQLGNLLERVQLKISSPTSSIQTIKTELRKMEDYISTQNILQPVIEITPANLIEESHKELERLKNLPFIGTGFNSIDKHMSYCFAPGLISGIFGRTSMGKSLLKNNIQRNLWSLGIPNAGIVLEQSWFMDIVRVICMNANIPVWKIPRVHEWLDNEEDTYIQEKFLAALEYIAKKYPIKIIEPRTAYSLNDIKALVLNSRDKGYDCKVVFIDMFAQLSDVNVSTNSPQVIQQKLFALLSLCKELQFHAVCIVQFGRMKGEDTSKIDMREKPKGSGSYEEIMFNMFSTHRPAYYTPDEVEDNVMEVTIMKQKDGKAGISVDLDYNNQTMLLKDRPEQ